MRGRRDRKYCVSTEVKFEAQKRERENLEFRTFLKCNADDKELDEQFARLHKELFANYDCNRCRNCCKVYHGSIPETDIENDFLHFGMDPKEFVERYLGGKDAEGNYQTKHKLCDFLEKDGRCKLGDCKPDSCKKISIYKSTRSTFEFV